MIPSTCKRLIEVDFPIAKVSEYSAKEKSIRHGHPSTLHLWWARRPLAACRSVLLGLLLPDPCDDDCPEDFITKAQEILSRRFSVSGKSKETLRETLLVFIGEFANWDLASNKMYLGMARDLVKSAHPDESPVVVDPFSGGGSIPLEALRVGCEAFASDLNPVACLILKTLLNDIPRYGNAEFVLRDDHGQKMTVQGLANALRHVGQQIKSKAEKELAEFYPVDPDGSRPIAYLWARTVRCESVGCGAEIPLVRSFWLCKKSGRKRALRYTAVRPNGQLPQIEFEIFTPKAVKDVPECSVERANATCLCCGTVLPATRVRAQLSSQHGGADVTFNSKGKRIGGAFILAVAVLHTGRAGRAYRLPTNIDYESVYSAQTKLSSLPQGMVPDEPLPWKHGHRAIGSPRVYGMQTWRDMFMGRQALAVSTIAKFIKDLPTDQPQMIALNSLLACCLTKLADLSNACCGWEPMAECPRHLFARQALPIVWDMAEGVPTGDSSGSFEIMVERQAYVVEQIGNDWKRGNVQQADAQHSPLGNQSVSVWFTDPPYWDNVAYADLSDFFYVWFKRSVHAANLLVDPADMANVLTPKDAELTVTTAARQDSAPKDGDFFFSGMGRVFSEGHRVLLTSGVGCVVFAHKTTEGWESLLSGMLTAGWVITASWPITTEMATRMVARDTAALAGSVHIVCRPRPTNAGSGDWGEVKVAMEKRIREWLPTLQKHGVRGADAIFSCLGPALESYSRYDRVLTAADHEVPLGGDPEATEPHLRGFLAYVFEALSKEALREILGTADTDGFEEDARLTALFLWTLQATKSNGKTVNNTTNEEDDTDSDDEEESKPTKKKAGFAMPFDTFIRITRPMGIHYPTMEGSLIDIEKGVVRMLPVRERSEMLIGEAASRPGMEITLDDVKQMEFGFAKQKAEMSLPKGKKGSRKVTTATQVQVGETTFTTLDRLHRAMLLFSLGRSTLLRQVLEAEMKLNKRFERLALALNALYPDGSEERRMLEGVQAAMRGVK